MRTFLLSLSLIALTGCSDYELADHAPGGVVPQTADADRPELDLQLPDTSDDESADPCLGEVETVDWFVEFPAQSGCNWNAAGTLGPSDRIFRGHETQWASYDMSAGEHICDVRFEFASDQGGIDFQLRYDDHLLLTFNDRIVFATDEPLVRDMARDAGGYALFEWRQMYDQPMNFYPQAWAVGDDFLINLPSHDTLGAAAIAIDPQAVTDLTSSALSENTLDLALHSFGDNDPTDCGHTGLGFWVEIDRAFPQ